MRPLFGLVPPTIVAALAFVAAPQSATKPATTASDASPSDSFWTRTALLEGFADTSGADGHPSGAPTDALEQELKFADLERDVLYRDGTTTAYALPLAVARDDQGEPLPFSVLDRKGRELEPGRGGPRRPRVLFVPPRQRIDCLHEPAFRGFPKHRIQTPEVPDGRAVWIDKSADFELAFERFGQPARVFVEGGIVGGFDPKLSPRVTLLVGGVAVATKDLSKREELGRPLELAAATGRQKLVLRVEYPSSESAPPRLAIAEVRLEELPLHERLLLTTEGDPTHWRLHYRARAPAVATPFEPEPSAAPTPNRGVERVALLAGDAALVVDPPQTLSLSIDGGAPATSSAPTGELPFHVETTGAHELVVSSPAAPIAGRLWIVQPGALPWHTASLGRAPLPAASLADGRAVVQPVQVERDARPALVLSVGWPAELKLPAGPGGRLVTALAGVAIGTEELGGALGEVLFEVVDASGAATPIGGRPIASGKTWEDVEFSLPAVGEGAKLRVTARASSGRPRLARTIRWLVADPTLLRLAASGATRPCNVLVYLIDTLRADHCSTNGYTRRTTPALESIGAEGLVFENAYANASWTRPATATVLTGLLQPYHGVGKTTGLSDDVETLAERMRATGRATACFAANPHVYAAGLLFEQGYGRFQTEDSPQQQFRADRVNGDVVPWLRAHAREPFFLYVHTVDPHGAYDPPESTRGRFQTPYDGPITPPRTLTDQLRERAPLPPSDLQHVIDLYDEEILANDAALGALRDELVRLKLWDDTLVVVLSDHGEEFQEHGSFGHGGHLWEELLRVPLVVKAPKSSVSKSSALAPRRVATIVRQLDVVPTVLSIAEGEDAARGAACQGVDLVEWTSKERDEPLWTMAHEQPGMRSFRLDRWAVIQEGLEDPDRARTQLFDLGADPHEQHDLFAEQPAVAKRLVERMEAILADFDRRYPRRDQRSGFELGEHDRSALRRLGYTGQ